MQIGTVFKEVPIEGSPYENELYKMGVTSVHGKEMNLLMRFDAYTDQIEMIDARQKKFNLLKRPDLQAEFEGKTYKLLEYRENGVRKTGYFNPLTTGEAVLYFKPRKVFIQAEKPENGYDEYTPPHFAEDHAYYIQVDGEMPEEIHLGKRSLLKHLRHQSKALKRYIEENDLKLATQSGAVDLINYYNSLD